jgi:CO dehydrogenase/acetyl-CoA synthase beta subunit
VDGRPVNLKEKEVKKMKIRIPKEMYDKISDYALENDITFDEALLRCFKIDEQNQLRNWTPMQQQQQEQMEGGIE